MMALAAWTPVPVVMATWLDYEKYSGNRYSPRTIFNYETQLYKLPKDMRYNTKQQIKSLPTNQANSELNYAQDMVKYYFIK